MNLKSYFKKAQKEGWAIGQFNFSNLEVLKGIIQAASAMRSPVILGTSEGESKFFGLKEAAAIVNVYKRKTKLPFFLNLDHGKTFEYIKKAIGAGYEAVQFDGSELSLSENIALTKKITRYAKKFGVLVEGEVGIIGAVAAPKSVMTDPFEALKFVRETKVDSLAVAIGNLHGMRIAGGVAEELNLDKLKEIKSKTRDFPLVLHGGSGVREEDIKAAIKSGIVKININTELRVAYTNALKKVFRENPGETTPYKYLPGGVKAIQEIVEEKIKLFGSRNRS